jgi:hypothetical protein
MAAHRAHSALSPLFTCFNIWPVRESNYLGRQCSREAQGYEAEQADDPERVRPAGLRDRQ